MNKILLTILFLCLLAGTVTAQERTVSGKVTDVTDGLGLPGVNVVVQGTTKGTTTDADGNYTLTLAPNENLLVFSFVGYSPKTVSADNQSTLNIAMEADITSLNEIVVIGYGTQQEKDLTSAISTIKSDAIVQTPTGQAMQALQGRVPGVQIVNTGEPGGSPTVRIRGVGSLQGKGDPLYVVDGMFFDNIDFLNTADIETISILKDASAAAIYGTRAANGVVLIQTKSGNYEQSPQITYNGYYGVQVAQNVLKMANSEQFAQYVNETGAPADIAFLDAAFARFGRSKVNPNVPAVNTDWYDEVMKSSAPIQNHSLSIDGGGKGSRYSVGVSYFDQQGLLNETRNEYKRVNFRTKVDFDVNKWLGVGGNVNISNATRYVNDGAVWFNTYFAVPILPKYDELNTTATPHMLGNAKILGYRDPQNPFFNLKYHNDRFQTAKILGNFYGEIKLIPDKLTLRSTYNYSYGAVNERKMNLPYHNGLIPSQSVLRKTNTLSFNQIWDNILTYNQTWDAHNLTLMGGYVFRNEAADLLFGERSNLGTEVTGNEAYWYFTDVHGAPRGGVSNTGVGDWDANNKTLGKYYSVSFLGRVAYNYDDRYLVYGTLRREGSNKYTDKWDNFPTIGVGWVLSEEEFFDAKFVDFLKLRASWGKLGNDSSPYAVGYPTLLPISTAINDVLVNGSRAQAYYDLLTKWETTVETNIGVTARFLNERLSLDADYYIRDTENAATPITLPLLGETIRRNKGVIRNSGLEIALDWNDKLGSELNYSVGGFINTLKNEVRDLAGQQYINAGQAEFQQRYILGEAIESFYGLETQGVFQNDAEIENSGYSEEFLASTPLQPGDYKYKDQNNDGVIDDLDRVVLGSYLPKFSYGFNFGVSFKNFDLTATFQGVSGNKILNRKRGQMIFTNDTNIDAELAENLWRGEGTSDKYPSASGLRRAWNQKMSSYYVEDGSYFRIQNVRVSYNLVNKSVMGVAIPKTTFTFTAEKPVTVFNYNGFNPEVGNGIDTQTYPIPAVYTLGVNVQL